MNTAEIHTIEHLGATYLRNNFEWGNKTIYFGPMGCRTGFYMILAGDLTSNDVLQLVKDMFLFIKNYEGDIPGACVSCIEIYCFYDRTVIEFLRSFIDYSYTWG